MVNRAHWLTCFGGGGEQACIYLIMAGLEIKSIIRDQYPHLSMYHSLKHFSLDQTGSCTHGSLATRV